MYTDPNPTPTDWRGPFLFVGNHLALDFLNTALVTEGQPLELLATPDQLADFLEHAGLLSPEAATESKARWTQLPTAAAELAGLRGFRESLRAAVRQLEHGQLPSPEFLTQLNAALAAHPVVRHAVVREGRLTAEPLFAPSTPADALAPLAAAALDVLTTAEPARVRQCGGCVVHFQDTSKKGGRRWCSMNLCGNRRKVAAYQRRKRETAATREYSSR